jgi:hypothetical protein
VQVDAKRGKEEPAAPAERGHHPRLAGTNTAAEEPRNTKKRVYIHPSMLIFQSHEVATSSSKKLIPSGQGTGSVMPTARLSGSQNTLNP